jgi:hypothetical protein
MGRPTNSTRIGATRGAQASFLKSYGPVAPMITPAKASPTKMTVPVQTSRCRGSRT